MSNHRGSAFPNPLARTDDLVVTEAGADTLVYDMRSHRAHSLDAFCARVWRLCDGVRDLPAIASALDEDSFPGERPPLAGSDLNGDLVGYAVERLAVAGLLEREPARGTSLSRRELLRRAAAAGVTLAVPAVLSVVAPSTLQSQASGCRNQVCFSDAECCALNSKCTTKAGDLIAGKCL